MRIKVLGVDFHYGSTQALKDVSFEVKDGDFVGVIGPNGAGKTTLLRCITKTLKPSVGAILIDEKDISDVARGEIAKNVGVVPQELPQTFPFTVVDIVLMGRIPHLGRFSRETKKDLAIAEYAMKQTDIEHLADRPIGELSGGEKQRVLIAKALAQNPRILLLDEPTVHLDISYQVEILNLVRRLREKENLTVMAVFHDLNLAAQYCDSLILLNRGKIEAMGPPEDVLTPENIKRVYRMEAMLKRHPMTGSVYLIPFSRPRLKNTRSFTIHLICGGGTGSPLMSSLVNHGYNVTTGVLNTLDTDYEVAKCLDIPVVIDPPFSPANEEAHRANLRLAEKADVVILTDMQVGWGNIKNLEAAAWALSKKIPLIMIDGDAFEERDFTGGQAQRILNDLKRKGAICIKDLNGVLPLIKKLEKVSVQRLKARSSSPPAIRGR